VKENDHMLFGMSELVIFLTFGRKEKFFFFDKYTLKENKGACIPLRTNGTHK
jgi:hypothetical protein